MVLKEYFPSILISVLWYLKNISLLVILMYLVMYLWSGGISSRLASESGLSLPLAGLSRPSDGLSRPSAGLSRPPTGLSRPFTEGVCSIVGTDGVLTKIKLSKKYDIVNYKNFLRITKLKYIRYNLYISYFIYYLCNR